MELTDGTLLGGRVIYRQPREGYRTGIEPVLLAASVPALRGERVLEIGTGAGAALLCLVVRVPGVEIVGVERDAELALVARSNIAANAAVGARVVDADVMALPSMPGFDHAIANPPWHDPGGPASPHARRDAAKRASPGLLESWVAAIGRTLRTGGSLTMALPATATADALTATASCGFGSPALLPLWPRAGHEARLLLVRVVKDGRGPSRVLSGLVLHENGGYSAAARAVLWDGNALRWV